MNRVLKAFPSKEKPSTNDTAEKIKLPNLVWGENATEHSHDKIRRQMTVQDALNVKTANYRGDYNPYKIPPDFELAEKHA